MNSGRWADAHDDVEAVGLLAQPFEKKKSRRQRRQERKAAGCAQSPQLEMNVESVKLPPAEVSSDERPGDLLITTPLEVDSGAEAHAVDVEDVPSLADLEGMVGALQGQVDRAIQAC